MFLINIFKKLLYQKVKPVSIDEIEKVYVINLERSQDRKTACMQMLYENFGEKFLNQKLENIFFRATDGAKDLVIEPQNDKLKTKIIYDKNDSDFKVKQTDKKYYILDCGTKIRKRKMTVGEIGCLMSHLRAINDIAKNNYKYGIIFEDDFCFNPVQKSEKPYNFYYNLQQALNEAPSGFDILKIDARSLKIFKKNNQNQFKTLAKIKHFFKYGYNQYWCNMNCFLHLTGAYAYIVSQKGAKNIIEFINKNTLLRESTLDLFLWNVLPRKYHFNSFFLIKHPLFFIRREMNSVIDEIQIRPCFAKDTQQTQ